MPMNSQINQEVYNESHSYIETVTKELMNGCQKEAYDNTVLFTPDGVGKYDAIWTRDFAYMVEYAGEYITDEQLLNALDYLFNHSREDGWTPDRVYSNGLAVYEAGGTGTPIGKANLDNSSFMVFMVYCFLKRLEPENAETVFLKWKDLLVKSMDLIPLSQNGLVYNDPQSPHSPYGFTDTVCKTGELFYESLLYWRASKMLSELLDHYSDDIHTTTHFRQISIAIEKHIGVLYNQEEKLFDAATIDCKQSDIWGNIYALYIDFPLGPLVTHIEDTLITNYELFMYQGQVRHLYNSEYWDRMLIEIPKEEYQFGAYWATATGWLLHLLYRRNTKLFDKTLSEVIHSFKTRGIYECINDGYEKLDTFVVSATNVLGGLKRIANEH